MAKVQNCRAESLLIIPPFKFQQPTWARRCMQLKVRKRVEDTKNKSVVFSGHTALAEEQLFKLTTVQLGSIHTSLKLYNC